jgi:hypothetical protein
MSSYTKPVRQCQDAPITIGTMNGLVSSQEAQRALLGLEHLDPPEQPLIVVGFGGLDGGPVHFTGQPASDASQAGRHDTPKVARGTLAVAYDTTVALGQLPVRVVTASGVCSSFTRISAGQYFVPVNGLTEFYADVTAIADDETTNRLVQQTPSYGSTQPGIYISTWQEATLGSNLGFELSEFGFHVTVYARHGEPFDPGAEGLPRLFVAGRAPFGRPDSRPHSSIRFVKV